MNGAIETTDLLSRGVTKVVDEEHLRARLRRGRALRVKLGIDPTAVRLHLGHAVVLQKLRAFQDAGHQAVLVIGDFTAQIGDPTGRDRARTALSPAQVKTNAKTYLEQVGAVLDPRRTEVRYNSEWLSKLDATELVTLLSTSSVQQLLAHETFAARIRDGQPLSAHELLYPLFQGYDSVAIKADLELGGQDQTYNVLAGRDVQRAYRQEPQDVMLLEYLIGTDGKQKMSKSVGNTIDLLDSPADMYGKVMSIPDKLIISYATLAAGEDQVIIDRWRAELRKKTTNPRDIKSLVAQHIVARYHGQAAADDAARGFRRVHQQKKAPDAMPTIEVRTGSHQLPELLVSQKIVDSRSAARRLIEQGGVRIDRQSVTDWQTPITVRDGMVLEIGKRRFYRITVAA